MKLTFLGTVAALSLMASQAIAQVVIEISPEQRTVIKEYVVKERPAAVQLRERVTVGATIPADVELRSVPSNWGPAVTKYRYIYSDDRVVLIEPSSRRVIQVID